MGDDAKVNFLIVAKDAATKVIGNVNKGLGALKSGAGAVASGFAKLATVGAAAATALAGGIAFAVKQAADEEKGILRLNTAIEANVKGRTDLAKVEGEIAKRQKELAFSDGELRDSLAALLPFTKSTEKAFEAQSVAADLARLKNIGLEDASRMVGQALNGNTRVLKQLGIDLPKTATQAEILGAIQAKVAGQADAYANSTEGQFTILNNSLADLVEEIGAAFLPVALQLVKWANESLVPAIQAALPTIIEFGKGFIAAAVAIGEKLAPVVQAVAKFVMENVVPALMSFAKSLFGPGGVADSVGGVVGPIIKDLLPVLGEVFKAVGGLIGSVLNFVGVLWGNGNGPLAIAVKAIGAAFKILFTIFGAVANAIKTVIDLISAVVNAIANSPIGAIIGGIGDLIGGVGNALFGGSSTPARVPVAATSSAYSGRIVVPAPNVTVNANLDGRQIARSVDVRLGATTRAGNFNRGR